MENKENNQDDCMPKKLLSTKAGTATSFPLKKTPSPTNKVFNALWGIKNLNENTAIAGTQKLTNCLQRLPNLKRPNESKN